MIRTQLLLLADSNGYYLGAGKHQHCSLPIVNASRPGRTAYAAYFSGPPNDLVRAQACEPRCTVIWHGLNDVAHLALNWSNRPAVNVYRLGDDSIIGLPGDAVPGGSDLIVVKLGPCGDWTGSEQFGTVETGNAAVQAFNTAIDCEVQALRARHASGTHTNGRIPKIESISLWPLLMNGDGSMKTQYYRPDHVHLSEHGYEHVMMPALRQTLIDMYCAQ